jgi:hypothetical protein
MVCTRSVDYASKRCRTCVYYVKGGEFFGKRAYPICTFYMSISPLSLELSVDCEAYFMRDVFDLEVL